jgi:serine/threonine protein kinase
MSTSQCEYENMEIRGKENKQNNIAEDVEILLSTSKEDGVRICDYAMDYLIERANKKIEERTADWEILNHVMDVPTLSMAEIEIGRFLGEGGFFEVHEIQNITLINNGDDELEAESRNLEKLNSTTSGLRTDDMGVVQNRRYMQENCRRPGKNGQLDCRYAIKIMKKSALSDPELFVSTLVDLAIEVRLLTSLKHPNIIKLRGIGIGTGPDSFIILDRLYETLTEKIANWKDKKENSFGFVFDFRGKKQKALLAERLAVAFDVASSLEYLHDRKYVFSISNLKSLFIP